MKNNLRVYLNDGETYSGISGCMIVDPDTEECVRIGEIGDSDTILRWMRIFFPNMQVDQDNDGQIVIYTGISE